MLELGTFIQASDGLPLLDPETKQKPKNLGRDYGDMCLAADGFAQVTKLIQFVAYISG